MAASRRALTKSIVEAAKPSKFGSMVWDARVPGFGCRIFPGKRVYVFRYRTRDGSKQRVATLGQHGPLTVDKARQMAADLYEQVRKGRDPVADAQRAQSDADREAAENAVHQRYPTTSSLSAASGGSHEAD